MKPPARILVTGATGAVGSTVMRTLAAAGHDVYGVSSRGGSSPRQIAWRIGTDEPPDELLGPWDVLVHCAADTRWNLSVEQCERANVAPLRALLKWTDEQTHIIHLSTSYATGLTGSVQPASPEAYRNTYEWSKAAAERLLTAERPQADIVRFPIVMGSRIDGSLDRYSGFFWLVSSLCTGAIPALVCDEKAYADIVSTDDIAGHVAALVAVGKPPEPRLSILGGGDTALRVQKVFGTIVGALNTWRADNEVPLLQHPPYVTSEQWNRFYLPFAEEYLDRAQLVRVSVFKAYQGYMSINEPFEVTHQVEDAEPLLYRSILRWAQTHAAAASRVPKPWLP